MERRWDAGCVTLPGSLAHALLALQMRSTRHVLSKKFLGRLLLSA